MKYLTILIISLISFYGSSQTFLAIALNANDEVIEECHFFVNQIEITPILVDRFYSFPVKSGDKLTIKHFEYETQNLDLPVLLENDTLQHVFVLDYKNHEANEVIIRANRPQKVAGEMNENVLDYLVFPENDLITYLFSTKRSYYLGIKSFNKSKSHELYFKPESLYLDCFSNLYILSKDTVYQILIKDRFDLKFIAAYTKKTFETSIKPIINTTENSVFFEKRELHDQHYLLQELGRDKKESTVYHAIDRIGIANCDSLYREIIDMYDKAAPDGNNIIDIGIWNGDLFQLGENFNIINKIIMYQKIYARPIPCYTYRLIDSLCIINLFDNTLTKIDYSGTTLKTIPLATEGMKKTLPLFDPFHHQIYLYTLEKKEHVIYKINTSTGTKDKIKTFTNIIHQFDLQIVGNNIYYLLRSDTGYTKLYQIRY